MGNHEYYSPYGENLAHPEERFRAVWGYPARYHWQAGDFVCIMLDHPDPASLADPEHVYISQETLTFLDETLRAGTSHSPYVAGTGHSSYTAHPAIIFLHCPLRNTVLARNYIEENDFHSLQPFFSPGNSQEVRAILAQHKNACLFFSGHTHTGWEAPDLVKTEQVGDHPITFVNLMSPWYTGRNAGPRLGQGGQPFSYIPDKPDIIPSFAVHIENNQATIRIREHLSRQWLKTWKVPIS
jgi:hypothetical protein